MRMEIFGIPAWVWESVVVIAVVVLAYVSGMSDGRRRERIEERRKHEEKKKETMLNNILKRIVNAIHAADPERRYEVKVDSPVADEHWRIIRLYLKDELYPSTYRLMIDLKPRREKYPIMANQNVDEAQGFGLDDDSLRDLDRFCQRYMRTNYARFLSR
jgi:hypothetical protein